MFVVAVTYGTKKNMAYAQTSTRPNAEALCKTAKSLGYSDAKVVTKKDFEATIQETRGGK